MDGKREKSYGTLRGSDHVVFRQRKVRYRVRCRNTFAGYKPKFWWNGAGLNARKCRCMEKRVLLSHVGSYEYELVKVRIIT